MVRMVVSGAAEDVNLADLGEMQHSIQRILLPTDGSEPAVRATQYAVLLAKLLGASIKAIYVDTGQEDIEEPMETLADDAYEDVHPSAKGLIIAKRLSAANGVECTIDIVRGGIAKRIVHTAEDEGAGMIVLGDTGRTGLKRIALGSVAEAVVKASVIPVLVIKAEH
jgi:nucleotide-binding universal stress UspA family protein